jgi:RHS repeat-associated protein
MQTTASGNQEEVCDSYPFGDGLSCSGGADATEHHFTGKERDAESGLDYFGARYLNSDLGRWMSPDWYPDPTEIPYANLGDPQSLNLYSYVHNDPNGGLDADGHCSTGVETSNCMDPEEYGAMAGQMMGAAYTAAASDAWNNLPSVEQDALEAGGTGFLQWEGLSSSGWGYIAGAMDNYLDDAGWVPVEVGQRGLKAWHGFLGLAGHSYIKDTRGGHQWEVLGDEGQGGGRQANQQVRDTGPNSLVPSDSGRASQPGNEVTEWLTPEQYATLTAQATYFLTNACPSCGANYRLTQYNSNTFVFNMLSQNPAGSSRPPAASYIAPGYSQQGGAWYGH